MTAAGQDGERLVTDETAEQALIAWHEVFVPRESYGDPAMFMDAMRAALVAVAEDLDRAGYDRARRECADELRDQLLEKADLMDAFARQSLQDLAAEWSFSGRAPAGEEEQR